MEMIKIITGFQEHADILYAMLQQKTHVISHHAIPSYEDHIDFIRNNPYRTWYLVKSNDRYVGHVYLLDQNNTMGLVFNNPKQEEVKFAIDYLKANYDPLPAIRSVRTSYFIVNIAPTNEKLAQIINDLEGEAIQTTYILK